MCVSLAVYTNTHTHTHMYTRVCACVIYIRTRESAAKGAYVRTRACMVRCLREREGGKDDRYTGRPPKYGSEQYALVSQSVSVSVGVCVCVCVCE